MLFALTRTIPRKKRFKLLKCKEVYRGVQRTVAHLGKLSGGFDALVAFRDCCETKL
jgi:hypothetical protein